MAEEFTDEMAKEIEEEEVLSWKEALRHSKLPIIVWLVFITTFFACTFGGGAFLGYSVAGYAWIVCLAFAPWLVFITHIFSSLRRWCFSRLFRRRIRMDCLPRLCCDGYSSEH